MLGACRGSLFNAFKLALYVPLEQPTSPHTFPYLCPHPFHTWSPSLLSTIASRDMDLMLWCTFTPTRTTLGAYLSRGGRSRFKGSSLALCCHHCQQKQKSEQSRCSVEVDSSKGQEEKVEKSDQARSQRSGAGGAA